MNSVTTATITVEAAVITTHVNVVANEASPRVRGQVLELCEGSDVYARELSLSLVPKSYGETVLYFGKKYLIDVLNFFKDKGYNEVIDAACHLNKLEDLSIKDLVYILQHTGRYSKTLGKDKKEDFKKDESEFADSCIKTLRESEDQLEAFVNGISSVRIINELRIKSDDYSENRIIFDRIKFDNKEGIESEIVFDDKQFNFDSVIQSLEGLKKTIYLRVISHVFDPNCKFKEKVLFCNEYFGNGWDCSTLGNFRDEWAFVNNSAIQRDLVGKVIPTMLCHFVYLQNLLDCLRLINKAPKILDNLKIADQVFRECYQFFEEDIVLLKIVGKDKVQYGQDHFKITKTLKRYKEQLNRLLEKAQQPAKALNQSSLNEDWLTDTTRRYVGSGKKNGRGGKGKGGQPTRRERRQQMNNQGPRKLAESSFNEVNKGKDKDKGEEESKDIDVALDVSEQALVVPVSQDDGSSSDGVEAVIDVTVAEEDDINPFMEAFLQFVGQGRKKKEEAAEAKRLQAVEEIKQRKVELKAEFADEEEEVIEASVIPYMPNLNPDEKTLLATIFSESPPHLKIEDSKVKNLIHNKLKGKVQGAGGYRFKVLWDGKQGGFYEVDHIQKRGFLKQEWVRRLADAIRAGEDHGWIPVGVLPPKK